jgi:biopolymer transport protein ExbD
MAQMDLQFSKSEKIKRKLHPALRIDMTPMVDLGFLLITFFIFTTTISEKKVMKLYMPPDGPSTKLGESKVLTVLLGQGNKVYAYEGKFEDAVRENRITATTYNEGNGIGNLIREKQKKLQATDMKEGRNTLVFLIKPTKQATYRNTVDALDEATINDVKRYMIVDVSPEEKSYLQKMTK